MEDTREKQLKNDLVFRVNHRGKIYLQIYNEMLSQAGHDA
jgi:hypothetical protein